MHIVIPGIITSLDQIPPTERTIAVKLLVAVVYSSLIAALHTEWALLSVCKEQKFVLGQSVAAMARRLGGDLRRRGTSQTATAVLQELTTSQAFVNNFPTFMAEL